MDAGSINNPLSYGGAPLAHDAALKARQALGEKQPGESGGGIKKFTILNTNDIHGKLTPTSKGEGGIENLAGKVAELREENPDSLLVDGGDISYDPPTSDQLRFGAMPEIMNKMGYDVLGAGNHEWQWEANKHGGIDGNPNPDLTDNLHELTRDLGFPVVNCNTVLESTEKRPDFLAPFVIKEVGGVKVGVTSVVTQEMATKAHPEVGEGWEVLDPSRALKETVPKMKEAGADVVVVLSHDIQKRNERMIRNTPGIDLVIGSHDHLKIGEPIMVKDPDGRMVPLVEAGSHGKAVGELDISYDPQKKEVVGVDAFLHEVRPGGRQDPEVADIARRWMERVPKQPAPEAQH